MSEAQQQEQTPDTASAGLSEQEQAAVEKGRQGLSEVNPNAIPESGPQRPEYVPEKFWKDGKVDTEAMARSYAELERKFSAPKEGAEDTPKPAEGAPEAVRKDGKIEPAKAEDGEPAPSPLQTAMERARDEWAEGQEVSEEARAELAAAGIPTEILDLYLDGLRAQSEKVVGEIHTIAGGAEAYSAMTSWAAKALSAEEIEAFNSALDNPAAREAAILGLQAKFKRANPSEGKMVVPNDGGAPSGDVFTSKEGLIAAQRDPRYQTDAGYRRDVMEKLARSQRSGFKLVDRPMFERTILTS